MAGPSICRPEARPSGASRKAIEADEIASKVGTRLARAGGFALGHVELDKTRVRGDDWPK